MSDFRYNPLTGQFVPEAKTEQHTIEYMPEIAAYAVRVTDGIQLTTPRSVTVEEDGTGIPFAEQTARTAPNAGEFWVDYEATGFYGSGLILFNAADAGKVVNISYNGLGRLVTEAGMRTLIDEILDDRFDGPVAFGGTVTAPEFIGDVTGNVTGNLTGNVTGDLTGSINIPAGGVLTHDGTTIIDASGGLQVPAKVTYAVLSGSGFKVLPEHGTWLIWVSVSSNTGGAVLFNGSTIFRSTYASAGAGVAILTGSSFTLDTGGSYTVHGVYCIKLA